MQDNAISAIYLWKIEAEEGVRLVATEPTPELICMKSADLISPENVEELIEQDDRVADVNIYTYLDAATAEAAKETILMSYRVRGIHEDHDCWPDVAVGNMTGGEGLLLVHSYDGIQAEQKIRLHDMRGAAGYDPKADDRTTKGSWEISKTDLARADAHTPQEAVRRFRAKAYADIAASDSYGLLVRALQDTLSEKPGAYVSFVDLIRDNFEEEFTLDRPEDAEKLQAALLDAAEHISGDSAGPEDDLSDVRENVRRRVLDHFRENYPEFLSEASAPTM